MKFSSFFIMIIIKNWFFPFQSRWKTKLKITRFLPVSYRCLISPNITALKIIMKKRCWKLRHFLAKIHFSETTKYIFLWRMLCWLGKTNTLISWCLSHMKIFSILLRFICYSAYCTERSNSNTAQCFSCYFGDIMAHHFSNCIVDCWWWNYYQR